MATRKRTKKQSLAEFRAWLNGVEELQAEDWAPNSTQWGLIRDKIDGIIEPKPVVDINVLKKLLDGTTGPAVIHNTRPPANIPPPPPQAGGVPAGPITAPTAPSQVDIAAVAKPNLDTTDGNYESGFS